MRDLTAFDTGPDGSLVLAVEPLDDEYDYEDVTVALSGRTIHVTTPDGRHRVGLEAVHGSQADEEN